MARCRWWHLGQRVDRLVGLRLLHVAEHGVHDEDQHDHYGIEGQRLAALGARGRIHLLDDPRDQRNGRRGKQQIDQRVLELLQELLPLRHWRGGCQLVRAELLESAFGLFAAQAGVGVHIEGLGHLVGAGERRVNVMQERLLGLHFLGFFGIRRFHMGFAVQCGWIYDAIIHK